MKKIAFIVYGIVVTFLAASCGQATAKNELKAADFKHWLDSLDNEILIDVRTPGEFSEGHIKNALNIDWNGEAFEAEAAKLDKSKPLFVYCLAGSRSAAAAEALRKMGFKEVHELSGGMLKWRAAGLPEDGGNSAGVNKGMSVSDFEAMLNTDKTVLVDFYATWCGPCKKMEPFLAELAKEREANLKVIRIDVDANPTLATTLKIDKLPTVVIYKKQQLMWQAIGFQRKSDLASKLDEIK